MHDDPIKRKTLLCAGFAVAAVIAIIFYRIVDAQYQVLFLPALFIAWKALLLVHQKIRPLMDDISLIIIGCAILVFVFDDFVKGTLVALGTSLIRMGARGITVSLGSGHGSLLAVLREIFFGIREITPEQSRDRAARKERKVEKRRTK